MADNIGDRCVRPLAFPRRIDNRPGLSRICHGVGTYPDFFERMVRDLNRSSVLAGWTHRDADDPGIALLEGAAVLGDILSFYQDLYANEAFLRTADWRSSVAELVRLVGYRLAPSLGGRGTFAFEIRDGDPVTVPAGFGLQLDLEDADEPAVFETIASLVAYPELSRFRLYRPLEQPFLTRGRSELWIRGGAELEFEEGDRLLLGKQGTGDALELAQPQIVVVEEVDELHDAVILKIEGTLRLSGSVLELAGYKLGRSFGHFGRTAPKQDVILSGGEAEATSIHYCRNLKKTTSEFLSRALSFLEWPLDASVDDLSAGGLWICSYAGDCVKPSLKFPASKKKTKKKSSAKKKAAKKASSKGDTGLVLAEDPGSLTYAEEVERVVSGATLKTPRYTVVRTVDRVENTSLSWGALSGASTLVTFDKSVSAGSATVTDIRSVELHEVQGGSLNVRARPISSNAATGKKLFFFGAAAGAKALDGRRVMLSKEGEEPVLSTASVSPNKPPITHLSKLHEVVLDVDVSYADFPQAPEEEEGVQVYGNLVDANQGKTEREAVLGNGDGRQAFQTFKIPKSPLTYHYASAESPPQVPELEIWVNDRKWERVDSLYGQGAEADVYVVREDDEGTSWVQFGDGKLFGSRLPSGAGNVKARYRTGYGAHGSLKPDTKVQATGRLDRLDKVVFPGVVSGGEEREQADVAREAAPGRVQSLGRLVSLGDFESEALAIAGVALASARWDLDEGVPAVLVTVLMETGREDEFSAVESALENAAEQRGADRFEIKVIQGSFLYVYLAAQVSLEAGFSESTVRAEVERALGVGKEGDKGPPVDGLFSLRRRRFGQREHASKIAGVIQNVEGVAWSRVTGLQGLAATSSSAISLPQTASNQPFVACPTHRVLKLVDRVEDSPFQINVVSSAGGGS